MNKRKIFNDPIYGFITIPNELIFDLIEHRYFQRLRRISQMGLSYLVYPGAHHTRFHHAIGCMHLMQKAIQILRQKGTEISNEEESGLLAAILLHDIGHGPFSHAMENSIVEGVSHETISMRFMLALNEEFQGRLSLAIQIFSGSYPRKFMHELISGQLDMDRADYLKRDSFYTGVSEGNINSERILSMLQVVDDHLVVEEKGIYSVEKFLLARRLMYWQVYLHKTSLAAEQMLIRMLQRAKFIHIHRRLQAPESLLYFMDHQVITKSIDLEVLERFAALDDIDILAAMKLWQHDSDLVLSKLCTALLNRELPRMRIKKKPFTELKLQEEIERCVALLGCSWEDAGYFVFTGEMTNQAYNLEKQTIRILLKSGKIQDAVKVSDQFNLKALSRPVTKHYLCHPKY